MACKYQHQRWTLAFKNAKPSITYANIKQLLQLDATNYWEKLFEMFSDGLVLLKLNLSNSILLLTLCLYHMFQLRKASIL